MDIRKQSLLLTLIIFFYPPITIFSQEFNNLKVESYILKNGFTVYLNEDSKASSVLGAVIIKTGGKYDPADATGMSHYLEHMLFKGTDKIGTTNYEKEKILLDSITIKYDELAATNDIEQKKEIQKQINELSIKAGDYVIPNETSKILEQIGSTNINAFTSNEIVGYYNMFPNNQMEKWLNIYSNRFINPVFRLFQSELETVFEEKNMYSDNFMISFIEEFYKSFYKNHPYGTQTIIGSSEHIRNPSLSKMKKMYDTYYIANNMALILTGNFNSEEVKPLIEKYFSQLKEGEVPEFPEYKEIDFNGEEIVKKRVSPIKMGIIAFRTVPNNNEDEVVLNVCNALLNNNSSTGLLDKLAINKKITVAYSMLDTRNDHGGLYIIYIPKILSQSLKKAKKVTLKEVAKLKTGDINPEFLEGIKLSLIKKHKTSLENHKNRAFMIGLAFTNNKPWDDVINYSNQIKKVNIDDIKRVSEKYLNENYLNFESKMCFPKNNKLEKPEIKPIIPKNSEVKSEFAENLEKLPESDVKLDFINFDEDVKISSINEFSKLYYIKNEVNDIFNLKIKFHTGLLNNSTYMLLIRYMSMIGTQDLDLLEFKEKLQNLGANLNIQLNNNFFIINISGFDENINATLDLASTLIHTPKADESKLIFIKVANRFGKIFEGHSNSELINILFEYGVYGNNSFYMNRLTNKEVSNLESQDLLDLFQNVISKPFNAHYTGTRTEEELHDLITNNLKLNTNKSEKEFPLFRKRVDYSENTILFVNSSRARQSQIIFYVNGTENDQKEMAISTAFNKYFGNGMSSLIFQEIREFRSLSYSSFGSYITGETIDKPGFLIGYVATQNDKTIEAISIMDSLISKMPIKMNRSDFIKSSLIQSINSNNPEWRAIGEFVETCLIKGFNEDPRIVAYDNYKNLSFDQIIDFYNTNIASHPMLITIVGNKKQINMEDLAKFGKVIEVKKKHIKNK